MITIAIPFYNAQLFLDMAIQSVFNQTYQDWKLLLIDDGSTDGSLEIALKYQDDPRVVIHADGQNKNLGFRLNQIPSLVTTKYLARMDADDIMHPQRIEKQVGVLEANPTIDVLGTNAYSMDEKNLVQGIRIKFSDKEQLKKVTSFIHPTIMAKKVWFENNPYDVKAERIEDAELWFRTASCNNFQILTEPLLFYRELGNSYYKKYYLANKSQKYILKKYNNERFWKKYFNANIAKGVLYQIFNVFGRESYLIGKRNQVIYKQKKDYLKFINND